MFRKAPSTTLITMTSAVTVALLACSTLEPNPSSPYDCPWCPTGQFLVWCNVEAFTDDVPPQERTVPEGPRQFCTSPNTCASDIRQQCFDACTDYVEEEYAAENVVCIFEDENQTFTFLCEGDGGTDDGGTEDAPCTTSTGYPVELSCPGWYDPRTAVSGYTEPNQTSAEVTIDAAFVANVTAEAYALQECDDGRYQEGTNGIWTFVSLSPLELFHELGFRNGDKKARVAEWDPVTETRTGSYTLLDSEADFNNAFLELRDAAGVIIKVDRTSTPTGKFNIKVTID